MQERPAAAAEPSRGEAPLEMVKGEGVNWVNLEKPSRRELGYLGQFYPFHPLDLDDCVSKIQLPKLDEYKDYLFVILHFPVFNKQARLTTASQVSFFMGKDFLVTVHAGDLKPLVKLFRDCVEKEEARQEYMSKDPGFLFYRIVDILVDYCFPMADKALGNLEGIEDKVFDDRVDAARDVALLRRDIAAQRRIIWELRAVLANLERKAQRFTKIDLSVYFGDVNDHLNRLWSTLDEAKETVEIYKDTDFVLSTDRTNRTMAILTILIAIMLPFTVVSGIYGMNIPLPGQQHAWFFPLTIFLMFGASALMLIYFR